MEASEIPPSVVDWVERVHAAVDELVAPIALAHGPRLRCRSGCHDCCSDGLSVFAIEAAVIERHHAALLESGTPANEGGCAFLDEAGACRIYAHRPYVCRTQGLPLRWLELDEGSDSPVEVRDVCPLNVEGGPALEELPSDQCWTLGPFEERLGARQAMIDGGAGQRVPLRSLWGESCTAPLARRALRSRRAPGLERPRYASAVRNAIESLRTPRVLLRQWSDADLEPYAAMNADPRVMEHFPSTLTREESDLSASRIRSSWTERGFGYWAVEVPDVTSFAGFVGLSVPRFEAPFTPCVEIAWRIAVEHWGRGYATEGARAALDAAFGELGLDEVISMTVPANTRSRRVMERLGLIRDPNGDFDHPNIAEGHPLRRHVLYRIRAR